MRKKLTTIATALKMNETFLGYASEYTVNQSGLLAESY